MKFISSAFFGGNRRSLYFCIIIFITTSKMKHKILLSLILCVLCSTLQASKVGDGIITFLPIAIGDTVIGKGDYPIHHAPAHPAPLPEVVHEGSLILFYPQVEGILSFRIEDATHTTVCSDNIYLYMDEPNEFSIASLPCGTYRLILAIAGREYEGEFTIE